MEDSGVGQKRRPLGVIDGNTRQTRSRTGQGAIKPVVPAKAPQRSQEETKSSKAVTQSSSDSAQVDVSNDATNSWRVEAVRAESSVIARETPPGGSTADAEQLRAEFDIDSRDHNDELACAEYCAEIYAFLRRDERRSMVKHDYMKDQSDINCKMRVILTDWLVEVHLKFKLRQETLYLTFQIIDRFLQTNVVARGRLQLRGRRQLVGVTALMIAAKYEEIYPPEVRDYVYICDNAYTREAILEMEKLILQRLDFRLSLPTVWSWMKRFVKAAGKAQEDAEASEESKAERAEFFQLVSFIVELAMIDLLDLKMLKYLPSLLVASAVHTALLVLKEESWTPQLVHHTQYSVSDLEGCTADLKSLLKQVGTEPKYKAVHKKFSHPKYKEVAALDLSHLV